MVIVLLFIHSFTLIHHLDLIWFDCVDHQQSPVCAIIIIWPVPWDPNLWVHYKHTSQARFSGMGRQIIGQRHIFTIIIQIYSYSYLIVHLLIKVKMRERQEIKRCAECCVKLCTQWHSYSCGLCFFLNGLAHYILFLWFSSLFPIVQYLSPVQSLLTCYVYPAAVCCVY